MENRLRKYTSSDKLSLPSLYLENPVLSPRSNQTYQPLSLSTLRSKNQSPDLIHSPTDLYQTFSGDSFKLDVRFSEVTEKVRSIESLNLIASNLKTLHKHVLISLKVTEKVTYNKALMKILDTIETVAEEISTGKAQIQKLLAELTEEKKKNKELILSIKQAQNQLQGLSNKFNTIDKNRTETAGNIDKTNRKHLLEKEKLNEKVRMLEDYINSMENVTKIEEISKNLDHYKDLYEKTLKEYKLFAIEKNAQSYKMQATIGTLKEEIASNKSYLQNFHDQESLYKATIKSLNAEAADLKQHQMELKERLNLFREDMTRYFHYKDLYNQSTDHIAQWKSKYQQLELNVLTGNLSLHSEGVVWVSLDDPIFEVARRNSSVQAFGLSLTPLIPNKGDISPKSPRSPQKKGNYNINIDLSEITLKDFKHNRPLFAGFLDLNDSTLPFESPFSNWLEVTIRGIYDSKYYEHQFCSFETGRTPSRLPDFVYSWLGNFTVDQVTRQVKEIENWKRPGADKIRIDLLLALAQDKFKKNWEIQTFVEFLNEDLMLDELAFYLHCRNMLFKGPQLAATTGQLATNHMLGINRVEEVIDIVMQKISNFERDELKFMLKKKAKFREGGHCLDSGLTLRLLLEYYIREKKSKFIAIRSLYNLAPKNSVAPYLAFASFKDILRNLNPDINEDSTARMYRECYSMCNGSITPDQIFIICNESGFFFNSLRLKTDLIRKDSEPSFVYSQFNKYKTSLNIIRDAVKNIGISELLFNFNRLEQRISLKEVDISYYGIKNSYKSLWGLIHQIQNMYQDVNYFAFASFFNPSIVNSELTTGPESCKSFIELLESLTLYRLSTKIAIRRIQRNWKEKHTTKSQNLLNSVKVFKKLVSKSTKNS